MPTNCRTPEPAFRQTGKNDHWAYQVTNKNSPARAGRTKNEHMKRRNFLVQIGAATAGLSLFQSAFGNGFGPTRLEDFDEFQTIGDATGKVLVIGGGMAGTTAAKYLRLWGGSGLQVTLIEPNATYYSNIFSNMVLTGERTLSQLAFNYEILKSKYGVKVVASSVTVIDPVGKKVKLKNGTSLYYDRLVLAPGIDFLPIPTSGTSTAQSKIVHAWKAGPQTNSLKAQIQGMTKSDTFIMTIPPKPYRCPPGPYERACVVADYLKRVK
jgi:pyruvate/2-oxoglutarate dehydrogenase complex dihydrolipoamide dehydrogenase (E3) component